MKVLALLYLIVENLLDEFLIARNVIWSIAFPTVLVNRDLY